MPFLQLVSSQSAGSHFWSGSGESSKTVPTFSENFASGCSFVALPHAGVGEETRSEPHRGHLTVPSGQRTAIIALWQLA